MPVTATSSRPRAAHPLRVTAGTPLLVVVALCVCFVVITAIWLAVDRGVPDFDNGRHLLYAFDAHDAIRTGDLTQPFEVFNHYPPLVHLVGALGAFVGGMNVAAPTMAENLVFVPLLALGCFGVARKAYGSLAGVLAAVFALGTPMVVSQFHVFMLDVPEAAMVAASAWAIVASDRFSRTGVAAAGGALCALGMLTKQTFPLFVVGLGVVALLRGGWRNWRGVLAFAAPLVVLAGPWYLDHLDEFRGLTSGATAGGAPVTAISPSRWSGQNFGWYAWNLLNIQVLLPLVAFFLVGVVVLGVRFLRRRESTDLTPELIAGGLCGYLGQTFITLKDPRYTLPVLVYLAALGAGWIPLLRHRARLAAVAALSAVALVNVIGVSTGAGHRVRVSLPGAPAESGLGERSFTLYSPDGYVRGAPHRDPDVVALLRHLHDRGVRVVDFDPGSANTPDFNVEGLRPLARIAGLRQPPVYDPGKLGPHDAFLLRRPVEPGGRPPCQRFGDGTGLYVALGNAAGPFATYTLICPGRNPEIVRGINPDRISRGPRASLLRLMRRLRHAGVRTIDFDPTSAGNRDFGAGGLRAIADEAGLGAPRSPLTERGSTDAFVLRHVRAPGEPAPCVRLSDGAGAYVVLGNPVVPFERYRFVCPRR